MLQKQHNQPIARISNYKENGKIRIVKKNSVE
jgi:hypothetical protein